MGYKYSFVSNETYNASDINEITKRLVTSGVEDPFVDGVPHNLKCFNTLSNGVVTDGVVYENDTTLKVSVVSLTSVSIESGTAFFNSGATITIDENKEFLQIIPQKINYIYLEHNEDLNVIRPVSSLTEPDGDIVMLAVIDESGNAEDKRKYAVGKVPKYTSCYRLPKKFNISVTGPEVFEIDVSGNDYSYFIIIVKNTPYIVSGVDTMAFWTPFEPKKFVYGQAQSRGISEKTGGLPICVYSSSVDFSGYLYLKYTGNILRIEITRVGANPSALNGTIEFIAV